MTSAFAFQRRLFALSSNTRGDVNKFERGSATALRLFVLLLAAYIVFHKIFPFAALSMRFADVTFGEFLLTIFQLFFALGGTGYLITKGFRYPASKQRDRIWCERWSGLAFGVAALIMGAALIVLLERKGINLGVAHWIARGILWLLA